MSTYPSAAPITPVEAVDDDGPAPQFAAISPRDLADLVAAIERVEGLIVSGAAAGSDGSAAIERIADIAFVLHEREVEASLCDALDAAVREISEANALRQAGAQRSRQAAALLRQLSRSLTAMIALWESGQHGGRSAATEAAEHDAAADGGAAGEGANRVATSGDDAKIRDFEQNDRIDLPAGAQRLERVEAPGSFSAAGNAVSCRATGTEAAVDAAPQPPSLLDPYEDPGDLFEPTAAMPASGLSEVTLPVAPLSAQALPSLPVTKQFEEAAAQGAVASGASAAVQSDAPAPRSSPARRGALAPPVAQPANDALAPILALSEEEMIALFS